MLKSCWRLYRCAALQASHAVALQHVKRAQLAAVSLDAGADTAGEADDTGNSMRSAAALRSITLFAEEIEAASAAIRLSDTNPRILGVDVTPQKLVLVFGYFVSGLVTLLARQASA